MAEKTQSSKASNYGRAKLGILFGILAVWFSVSFGCGILFRDQLDSAMPQIGNAPFGFWMAQQGSIICFVILLLIYNFAMNRLDAKYNATEG